MAVSKKLCRSLALCAALVLTAATAACDDDPIGSDDEPEIANVRVSVGTQSVTISEFGQQTGTLTVPTGNSVVAAAWLRADGQPEPLITSEEFELRLVPSAGTTGVTFTPAGAFGGTLNATTSGEKTVQLQLFHLEEQHADFQQTLRFTVQ